MTRRLVTLFLSLCLLVSLCITIGAELKPASEMTWSDYQALSSEEKMEFYNTFASSAEFKAWRKAAQDAEKPDAIEIGSGGTIGFDTLHSHCICGGSCIVGGHVHDEQAPSWTAIIQNNVGDFAQAFSDGQAHYFFLYGDITVCEAVTVGSGTSVHLCLNGHKLTSTAGCVFELLGGSASVSDCGTNGQVAVNAQSPMSGSFVSFGTPTGEGTSTFSLYGGTVIYENTATPAENGFISCCSGGTVTVFGGTLDANGKQASLGGGLVTLSADSLALTVYGGTFRNAFSAVAGGAIRSEAPISVLAAAFQNNYAPIGENICASGTPDIRVDAGDLAYAGNSTIDTNIPANSTIALDSSSAAPSLTLGDIVVNDGAVIDLNGGTLHVGANTAIIDLTVKSTIDCGTIVFDSSLSDDDIEGIVNMLAESGATLPNAEKCLPIKSGEKTYTVCKLRSSGGIYCPKVKEVSEGKYKFRMQPRFASQTAYDILASATEEDIVTVGFDISATYHEEPVYFNRTNDEGGYNLSCDFTFDNAREFYATEMDSHVFFFNVAGLRTGHVVTVRPYLKLNGHIVYQGVSGTECAVLTIE